MVWGSIARQIEDGTIDTRPINGAGLDEGYPMYVLPVRNFLELTAWKPHQDLLAEGKVRRLFFLVPRPAHGRVFVDNDAIWRADPTPTLLQAHGAGYAVVSSVGNLGCTRCRIEL